LQQRYPRAQLFPVSARTGFGLPEWFGALAAADDSRADLQIDYDSYAEGEAQLGWLNCTAEVSGPSFDGNAWLQEVVADIQHRLRDESVEVAHLKATVTSEEAPNELAVVQVTRGDMAPDAPFRFQAAIATGELVVNLRAEGDPVLLRAATRDTLAAHARRAGLTVTIIHEEHFRPSRPVPTHRLAMS
jgi:hypothetical protein